MANVQDALDKLAEVNGSMDVLDGKVDEIIAKLAAGGTVETQPIVDAADALNGRVQAASAKLEAAINPPANP